MVPDTESAKRESEWLALRIDEYLLHHESRARAQFNNALVTDVALRILVVSLLWILFVLPRLDAKPVGYVAMVTFALLQVAEYLGRRR